MLRSELVEIIERQRAAVMERPAGLIRNEFDRIKVFSGFANVITGVRRCGKSTLMLQWMQQQEEVGLFIQFEDPRLFDFEPADFVKLVEIIQERNPTWLCLDEVQVVEGWERLVRTALDLGWKVWVTGSNAQLLSRELGTALTGRHLRTELFPFSYSEYTQYKDLTPSAESFRDYLIQGGFPEFLKSGHMEVVTQLLEDVLVRDITVRHGIRDLRSLQRLAWYLLSNVGRGVSGNKLKTWLALDSTSAVLDYLSYLEDAYLIQLVSVYSHSPKQQLRNPRKVYAIDPGLVEAGSVSKSPDLGWKLENAVFLHLRRSFSRIEYFRGAGECDFIAIRVQEPVLCVQVCYELHRDNLDRELDGALEAAQSCGLKKAMIVTSNQSDHFERNGVKVSVIPAYEWLMLEPE